MTFRSDILALNPWGYWRLGETTTGTGSAVDSSGNKRHGTYSSFSGGAVAGGQESLIGGDSDTAVAFSTYGSVVLPGFSKFGGSMSLLAVVKPGRLDTGCILGYAPSTGSFSLPGPSDPSIKDNAFMLRMKDGYLQGVGGDLAAIGAIATDPAAAVVNRRYLVGLEWEDGFGLRLYRDGVQVATAADTSPLALQAKFIGGGVGPQIAGFSEDLSYQHYFVGVIDEAAIFFNTLGSSTWSSLFTSMKNGEVRDSFSRPDSIYTLGTADSGQSWTLLAGNWGVTSGVAQPRNSGAGLNEVAVIESGRSNGFVQATLFGNVTGAEAGLVFRAVDANHYWTAVVDGTQTKVYRAVPGLLGYDTAKVLMQTIPVSFGQGDVMRVEMREDAMQVLKNGAVIGFPFINSYLNTATKHGLHAGGSDATTAAFGNFRVDSLSTVTSVALTAPAGSVSIDGAATVAGPVAAVTGAARATSPISAAVTGVVTSIGASVVTSSDTGDTSGVDALNVDRSSAGIQLTLLTDHVPYQPGVVRVSVADFRDPDLLYAPEEGVWLFLDGESTSTFSVALDPDTFTNDKVLFPVDDLAVGAHTLTAGHWSAAPDDRTTVVFYVDSSQIATGAASPQYPPVVTSGRWTFQQYDFASLGSVLTYEFAINPSRLEESYAEAALTNEATTAYDGVMLTWEGERRPDRWTISGDILERVDRDALAYWSNLNQRLWVTDEFGRTVLAKIVSFQSTRKRDLEHAWRHTYTMIFDVLDGPSASSFGGEF